MAFNLKKVLKALLFSSSHALAIKDIQAAFMRFHETAALAQAAPTDAAVEPGETRDGVTAPVEVRQSAVAGEPGVAATGTSGAPEATSAGAGPAAAEPPEIFAEPPSDPELYAGVPALITATQIRETMDEIAAELRVADDGMLLIEGNSGYRIVTHPRFARWVRILRSEPPPVKLSQSSIETLAIVAYRQPVTRGEIETIRGVSAEAGVNKLLERELIYVVGRADLPGRPIQYGTTDRFLEFVGVKSLDELPASDVLSSRQIDEWLQTAMHPPSLSDTDMGLANEELPLDGPGAPRGEADAVMAGAAAEPAAAEAVAAQSPADGGGGPLPAGGATDRGKTLPGRS